MKKSTKDIRKQQIVAIDTNIFIRATQVGLDEEVDDSKGYFKRMQIIKRKAANGSLKLVILPQVFSEITAGKLTADERDLLQNYCTILSPKDPDEYARKVKELADKYVKSGVMKTENGKPTQDVIIMAQATVAGLNLISDNFVDFYLYRCGKVDFEKDESRRAKDIQNINEKMGYSFTTITGDDFVPRPYTSKEYVNIFKDVNLFNIRNKYEGFEMFGR